MWIGAVIYREKSGVTGFLAGVAGDEMGNRVMWEGWDFEVEPCRREAGYTARGLGWDGGRIISSCCGLNPCLVEVTLELQPGVQRSSLDGCWCHSSI